MPKYLVETISYFRHSYVIDCRSESDAKDTVAMNEAEEMSQTHVDESIINCREIDDQEYLRVFNKENDYLSGWTDKEKMRLIHKVNYDEVP